MQKRQSEEKSNRLSTLEFSLSELQESLYSKDDKIVVGKLLVEETKYKSDLAKNKEEYLKKLENAVKVQKMLKRQMKSQDVTLKEKIRCTLNN